MTSTKERIIAALSAERSPLREEGVRLAVDYALDRPLDEAIDLRAARDIVLAALTEDNVRRIVERHVHPGFERYAARVERSRDTLGDLVPEGARHEIRDIAQSSRFPRATWAKGAVDPALVRRLLAPVSASVLSSFVKRMSSTSPGTGAGARGIAGRLSRSVQERAERLVDAGRSVMGGLGAEIERRMQTAAREFGDGAADVFREALAERLKSDEGAAIVREMTRQVVDRVFAAPLSALHEDATRVPQARVLGVTPAIVAHASRRPFVREIVDGEIEAFLAREGGRSLRDVLDELGALEPVRAAVVTRVDELSRGLVATPAFGDWVARLLDA